MALIGLVLTAYAGVNYAHDAGAVLDPTGTIRNFTGQAAITCFNDDEGRSDRLRVRIRDLSPPVPGLLVNVQIYKQNQSNSITDTISGDADWSPVIVLQGGPGTYGILVNKTDAGARQFELEYHCIASDGVTHTGTDISVSQYGTPVIE